MQLNITTDYAIRVLLCLLPEGKSLGATEIAAQARVPKGYLSFIMAKLKKAGLVNARRGQIGGYRLMKPAVSITLWDIIQAMERSSKLISCMTEGYRCEYLDAAHCPIQQVFRAAQHDIENILSRVSLADLDAHAHDAPAPDAPESSPMKEAK
jgi:Rrf2 family protein